MKATGIVRRIDDLGRVVIPKEIRRTMRIREGSPLEIYTDREGEVIFKKYSPVGEMASFAYQYAETLNKVCQISVVVSDRDTVIACAGISKKEYAEKKISPEYEEIVETRGMYTYKNDGERVHICEHSPAWVKYAMPIVSEGDIVGSIACVTTEENDTADQNSTEAKLIQTASSFLGRQFEG
ncbi:MAG: AbrB/MazE/SpoVT family DNA-binding domain-containing protein [Clostridia bacterium]|nr:AbrB/MazE/SpoVT family DNA-binding domain-containing protein [Clostridia bacterium]